MTTSSHSGTRRSKLGASLVTKRSVVINGRKTSVAIEKPFWDALREIAMLENMSIRNLVTGIDRGRQHSNLSSTIRVFVLDYYRTKDRNITG
jgi:predicted DNA-binding ribbon-helix-helix protein